MDSTEPVSICAVMVIRHIAPEVAPWGVATVRRSVRHCVNSGGVWKETPQGIGDCVAPPATSPGSGQLPGKVRIPPDLSAVPVTPVQPPPDGAVSPPLTNA